MHTRAICMSDGAIRMTISHSEAKRANERIVKEMGRPGGPTGESFSEFVTMKVIARKRIEQYGNPFGANAMGMVFSDRKDLVRNVCVRVDPIRLAELDALMELLDCNKQEFVLELLVAGIEQTKAALREAGLEASFDTAVDQRLKQAGFAVAQRENGFWGLTHDGATVATKEAQAHRAAAEASTRGLGRAIDATIGSEDAQG